MLTIGTRKAEVADCGTTGWFSMFNPCRYNPGLYNLGLYNLSLYNLASLAASRTKSPGVSGFQRTDTSGASITLCLGLRPFVPRKRKMFSNLAARADLLLPRSCALKRSAKILDSN